MWEDAQFDVAGFRELQRQVGTLSAQFAAGASAVNTEFAGGDPTGAVEVTIDGDGHPMRVRLASDWAQAVGARGLGAAVVSALQAALQGRLAVWAQAVADASESAAGGTPGSDESGNDESRRAEGLSEALPGNPSSAQSLHAMRDMFNLIDDALEDLEQLQHQVDRLATQSDTTTNSNHTVRVTTAAGAITSIEFDEEWLRSSTRDRIADAVEQALRNSVQRAAERQREMAGSIPMLVRVQGLASSPETLLRQVGLIQ